VIALGLSLGTAAADAATLVNQTPPGELTVRVVPSFDFPDSNAYDSQGADDFTVPAGRAYTVGGVFVRGYNPGGAGTDDGIVTIFKDRSGPGAVIFTRSSIPLDGGTCPGDSGCDFTAPLTGGPTLGPGRYWISVQGSGQYPWQWATTPAGPVYGSPAMWQNPGNGFSEQGCPSWRTLTECDLTDPSVGTDLIYDLTGGIADSRFTIDDLSSRGRRVTLHASFPSAGSLALSGKGVKRDVVRVVAGHRNVRVGLDGSIDRALDRGDTARVRLTGKFVADGGVPYARHASVTLRPKRRA